jgi:hypothetical protein
LFRSDAGRAGATTETEGASARERALATIALCVGGLTIARSLRGRYTAIEPSPTTTDAPPTFTPVTSAPLIVTFTCSRLGRRASTP